MKREYMGNAYGNGLGTTCGFWTSRKNRPSDKEYFETLKKEQDNNKKVSKRGKEL